MIPERRTAEQEEEAAHRERIELDRLEEQLAADRQHDEESDTDHNARWLEGSGEDSVPS